MFIRLKNVLKSLWEIRLCFFARLIAILAYRFFCELQVLFFIFFSSAIDRFSTVIHRYLNGKTFKPDTNYFFDGLGESGTNGYTNGNGDGFGDNVTVDGQWTQDLKNKCESSSIKFYYGEGGQLMADAVNAGGTTKSGIIVTVDEKNKTLAFSSEPFDYHWAFTDKVSWGQDDCWLLLAQNEEPEYGSFTLNTAVNDIEKLFAGDKLHLAFWSTKDDKYYVVNFVME